MKIHYLNSAGEEKILEGIVCLQNLDSVRLVALTSSGRELNLLIDRIESVIDDKILIKEGAVNANKE